MPVTPVAPLLPVATAATLLPQLSHAVIGGESTSLVVVQLSAQWQMFSCGVDCGLLPSISVSMFLATGYRLLLLEWYHHILLSPVRNST